MSFVTFLSFLFSFDGCANVCLGQARAVMRPATTFVNPERRRNPAQKRKKPVGETFGDVATAGQRCIDKIEQVEEMKWLVSQSANTLLLWSYCRRSVATPMIRSATHQYGV